MTFEIGRAAEAILKKLRKHRFIVGERGKTIANIAGRQDAETRAQSARRAAVIRDGDDCGEVARMRFESAQQSGESMSAADRHDARSMLAALKF